MKCEKCGFENADNTFFCKQCGERLVTKPMQSSSTNEKKNLDDKSSIKTESLKTQEEAKNVNKENSATQAINININPEQKTNVSNTQSQPTVINNINNAKNNRDESNNHNQQFNNNQSTQTANNILDATVNNSNYNTQVTYDKGCTSSAWSDIRRSSGWVKKLLLAGLCNIIPIINFGSCGYAQKWGAEIANGCNNELKSGIFENQSIKTGFFEWVTWVAYGFIFFLISQVLSFVLGRVVILGVIISIVLFLGKFVWDSFVALNIMNSAIKDKLSASFDIANMWKLYRKDFPKILCAFIVPFIICAIIAIVFCIIIVVVCLSNDIEILMDFYSAAQYAMKDATSIGYVIYLISTLFTTGLLCYAGIAFITGIERIIRYRAIGHYINRYSK